jgi:hypothetical protein
MLLPPRVAGGELILAQAFSTTAWTGRTDESAIIAVLQLAMSGIRHCLAFPTIDPARANLTARDGH